MTDQKHVKEQFDYTKSKYFEPLARAYCRPECSNKITDAELVLAMTKQLEEELETNKPLIIEQLYLVMKQRDELREALEKIQNSIPACIEGELIVEHFDYEGNYAGSQQINPLDVIGGIVAIANEALTKTKESV